MTDITSEIGLAKTIIIEFCMAKPLPIIEIYIHDPRTRVKSSAAFEIRLATSFSRSLPIVFKSAMGRYDFGVSYLGFCGFLRTIVIDSLNPFGWYPRDKHALNSSARSLLRVTLHFLRSRFGIPSGPGALSFGNFSSPS